jgi:NAD(P)-dependent dehydrogenase (short-subunit alcohol dehydrogenase family)
VLTTDFAGKRVFVVGGSMGIGLAAAKRFAALGASLALFARRLAPLEAARAECERMRRDPAQPIAIRELDVRDAAAVEGVLGAVVSEAGPPDVLLNCAGRAYPRRFEEITREQLADTIATNLYGCWHTVRAVLPAMKPRGGYVVNTASLAGLIGVYGYTDYCASKFAVVGFSEALRSELKPYGITVSVLCPPDTDTPGFAVENTTKPPETHAVSANAKVLTPDQVADALLAGMAREAPLIVPGRDAKLSALAKRLFPGLVERTMDRAIARVRR